VRTPIVLLLLLVLVAIPAAIFLIPDGSGDPPPGPGEASAAELADDPAQQDLAAAGAAQHGEAGRAAVAKDLLVQALQPDGVLADDSRFLVREGERTRAFQRADGRLTLPSAGPGFEAAVYAGGRWSESRKVNEEERRGLQELSLTASEAAVAVELEVLGADGLPAPEFQVQALWSGPPPGEELRRYLTGLMWSRRHRDTLPGSQGELVFEGLPAGTYTFRVSAEGTALQRPSVSLAPGQRERLTVRLQAGAFVRGRVTSLDGAGIEGAQAFLLPELARNIREMVPAERWPDLAPDGGTATTDADGGFRLGPVPPGEYLVLAAADGFLTAGPPDAAALATGDEQDVGAFALEPGRGLELLLVRAEDGAPVEGAQVRYLSGTPDENMLSSLVPWERAPHASDAEGRLRIDGLPPGRVTVQAEAEGRARVRTQVPADQGDQEAFRIELGPSLGLSGLVLDARDAQPVAGAQVRVLPQDGGLFDEMFATIAPEGGHLQTTTDEQGRFELDGLGPGAWRLAVQHEDYASQTAGPFPLDPMGARPEVTIQLLQGASLFVTVLDDQDQPMADTILTVHNFDGQGGPRGEKTDEQGQHLFEHLPAGNYQVQAIPADLEALAGMAGGNLSGLRTIADFIKLEDEDYRELVLGGRADSCTLQGYLTCGDEVGADLSVMLVSLSGTRIANSDDVGFYEFDAVRAGEYLLMVGKFGLGSGSGYATGIHVSGTGVMQHDIELPMTRLTVRVSSQADGKPVPSVAVMVRREDGGQGGGFQLTDDRGETTFRYLDSARYIASVGRAAMPIFGGGGEFGSKVLEVVELGEGVHERLEVALDPGAEVLARVLDPSGNPVQGAAVFVLDEGGQPLTLFSMTGTGADGRMSIGSLPGGRVRLLARKDGMGQVEQEVWLQPGERAETDLVLQPGCTLRILVVDEDGAPLKGIQAICFDERGAPLSMMVHGPEAMQRGMSFLQGGEQTAGPLPPGKYRVALTELGAKTVSHEVTVEPGVSELRLDLPFPR